MHKIKRQPNITIEGGSVITMNEWLKTAIEHHLPFGKGYANIKKAERILVAMNTKPEGEGIPLEDFIEISNNDFTELYNAVQGLSMKPMVALAVKSFYEAVERAKE